MVDMSKKVNELQHFGILGMKWGVRKDDKSGSKNSTKTDKSSKQLKRDNKLDNKWARQNLSNTLIRAHNGTIGPMNLFIEKLNKKWENKEIDAAYYDEYAKEYAKQLNAFLGGGVRLPSGARTMTFEASIDGSGSVNYVISDHELEHVNVEDDEFVFTSYPILIKDVAKIKNSRILSMRKIPVMIEHGSNDSEDSLSHYGILGMRWGVRRDRGPGGLVKKSVGSEDFQKARELKARGAKNLTNAELRALNERMNLEQQFNSLSAKDISSGQKIVNNILSRAGNKILEKSADKAAEASLNALLSSKTVARARALINPRRQ